MPNPPAGIRFRKTSSSHDDILLALAMNTVRIGHRQATFVIGVRLEIQDTSREETWRDMFHEFSGTPHAFIPNSKQRQCDAPLRCATLAILDVHRGVPVIVAFNLPLKPKTEESWGFDNKLAGCGRIASAHKGADKETSDTKNKSSFWGETAFS